LPQASDLEGELRRLQGEFQQQQQALVGARQEVMAANQQETQARLALCAENKKVVSCFEGFRDVGACGGMWGHVAVWAGVMGPNQWEPLARQALSVEQKEALS